MPERDVRERDILVASNEFAYVQDLTKGDIVLYVGPTKISLSNTERLVEFKGGRFSPVRGDDSSAGVNPLVAATSSQYIILENPPKDLQVKPLRGSNGSIELLWGRKVVVPGPTMFPLWPGQRANVIDGHELREDEYLIVRVYDKVEDDNSPIGTEKVIKGSDVSFYIPSTGLEVVPTPDGRGYVRKARVLRKSIGLHVRVIKPFVAEQGDQVPPGSYAAGQELFLKEREGFFFPTEQLEIVGEVQPIPIADKEGIYVREIDTGRITTVVGPSNYLPDPTKVEVISRPLDAEAAGLYRINKRTPARALSIYVPPSFAVLVTAKNRREIVRGPQTRTLDFDEELEILRLSTGRPKSTGELLPTCFLQTDGNKVSDVVQVRTADHVELAIELSYRVSFVVRNAEAERWFNVENYVGLLCDHLASILRAIVRSTPIEALHVNSTEIVRGAILGDKRSDGKREGRYFEENGMWVYDVEVLDVRILDTEVKKLLEDAQRAVIRNEISRRHEELRLSSERLKEHVGREICQERITSAEKALALEQAERESALLKASTAMDLDRIEKMGRAKNEAEALAVSSAARLEVREREGELQRRTLEAKVAAFKEQMAALEPQLVSVLKSVGNQHLMAELSKNLSPLAILGGESVSDVAVRLLGALPIGLDGEKIRELLTTSDGNSGTTKAEETSLSRRK